MAALKLFPIAGMNNVGADDGLQQGGDSLRLYLRDAVNLDITDTGRLKLRQGTEQVVQTSFKNIWQSPLHKDVFATLDKQLVKLNSTTWQYEVLANIGSSSLRYEVVNNLIYFSNENGIWTYDGSSVRALTIDTPAKPIMTLVSGGSLKGGSYSVAISWLRAQQESGLSPIDSDYKDAEPSRLDWDTGFAAIQMTLPYCLDITITGVRVYVTERNGGELRHYADYPIETNSIVIPSLAGLGMAARFKGLSPMPTGKYMKYWQGRLITADKNILRFSEPLAYHLHDERHGFVVMPQKITFILPVDEGIWVGQVTHVVFLTGTKPQDMTFQAKTSRAPVPDSAIEIDNNDIGGDISQGGNSTALWLAENGYVVGTSSGQVIELQAGVLQGIVAKSGRSVRLGRRITTIVT